jgi:hypothetical protein
VSQESKQQPRKGCWNPERHQEVHDKTRGNVLASTSGSGLVAALPSVMIDDTPRPHTAVPRGHRGGRGRGRELASECTCGRAGSRERLLRLDGGGQRSPDSWQGASKGSR